MLSAQQDKTGYGIVVALLLPVFAFFVHHPLPGLLVSAGSIILSAWFISRRSFRDIIGQATNPSVLAITTISMAVLTILGTTYLRVSDSLSPLPQTLRPFAIIAVLIGSMEELVFRGWMASSLKSRYASVLIPALAHAAYKSALFLSPHIMFDLDVASLFRNTFLLGVLLGVSRQITGSVWPALIAHALFDLLVYGDAALPWWVM